VLGDVVGRTESDARRYLTDRGYQVNNRIVTGNPTPRGMVVRATAQDGLLREGGTVMLEISDGVYRNPAPAEPSPSPDADPAPAPQPIPGVRQEDIDALLDAFGL